MTKEALKMAGYNLDGVIADIEKFDGLDDVCIRTIKRVRNTIAEALEIANCDLKEPAKLTRLEVIDNNGRAYVNMAIDKLEFSYQDEGRTLKIFTNGAGELQTCQECENLKHDLEGYMNANKKLINKEWQELTDEDFHEADGIEFRRGAAWAEQMLWEKNT